MSAQLALTFEPTPSRRSPPENAFDVYVAPPEGRPEPTGPLPILAPCRAAAVAQAAVVAGVTEDRCLALAARDWSDELVSMLDEANRRAEADLRQLRQLHAQILGCSIEELDARLAAEKAEEDARRAQARAARPVAARRGKPSSTPNAAIGTRRLNDRERELVSMVQVESNLAVYQPEEQIPDWSLLKDVMRALGGTWKTGGKKAKGGFRFADDVDAAEVVRLAVATGEILDARAAEFFETSEALADELVAYVAPKPGDRLLEPSAGRGVLVCAALRAQPDLYIDAVEAFEPNIAEHLGRLLNGTPARAKLRNGCFNTIHGDFLLMEPGRREPFDCVVMNPPFSKQQDIRHILHAARFLRPGGKLAAIASAGVAYRDDKLSREFRAWVERNGGTIIDNPEGSFAHAGTGVRTVRVFVTLGGTP